MAGAGLYGMGGPQGSSQGGPYAQQGGFGNQYLSPMGQPGSQGVPQQDLVRIALLSVFGLY